MQDAAAGGHPLHAAGTQVAAVAMVVAMLHVTGKHVGHGFEATMRMLRKASDIVASLVGTEFVQQQERVDHIKAGLANDALEAHAGTVGRVHAADAAENAALGHKEFLLPSDPTKMAPNAACAKPRVANGLFPNRAGYRIPGKTWRWAIPDAGILGRCWAAAWQRPVAWPGLAPPHRRRPAARPGGRHRRWRGSSSSWRRSFPYPPPTLAYPRCSRLRQNAAGVRAGTKPDRAGRAGRSCDAANRHRRSPSRPRPPRHARSCH